MNLTVVSGAIIRNGRILLTQRRSDTDFPKAWETPGGKVIKHETCYFGLIRELEEEIDVTVLSAAFLWRDDFPDMLQAGEKCHVSFWLYHVTAMRREPRSKEGQGFGWFNQKEILGLMLAPGTAKAVPTLLKTMERNNGY